MKIKRIVVLTAVFSILFQCACLTRVDHKTTKEHIDTIQNWPRGKQKNAAVLEVIKKSGESIVFSEQAPGHIESNTVSGAEIEALPVTIETADIKTSLYRQTDDTITVETIDGKFFILHSPDISEATISGIAKKLFDGIPFSDIESLWIRQVHNSGENALITLVQGIGVGFLTLVGLLTIFSG
jgi:hypothetical protein